MKKYFFGNEEGEKEKSFVACLPHTSSSWIQRDDCKRSAWTTFSSCGAGDNGRCLIGSGHKRREGRSCPSNHNCLWHVSTLRDWKLKKPTLSGITIIVILQPHQAPVPFQSKVEPHDEKTFSIFVSLFLSSSYSSCLPTKTPNFPWNAQLLTVLHFSFDLRLKTMAHVSTTSSWVLIWEKFSFLPFDILRIGSLYFPWKRSGGGKVKGIFACLLPEHERRCKKEKKRKIDWFSFRTFTLGSSGSWKKTDSLIHVEKHKNLLMYHPSNGKSF